MKNNIFETLLCLVLFGAILCSLYSCNRSPKTEVLTPEMAPVLQERALHHSIQGNKDSALYLIDKAIAAKPSEPDSYLTKISILDMAGNLDASISTAQEAVAQFPEVIDFRKVLATSTERLKGVETALPLYISLLKLFEQQGVYNEEAAYIATISMGKAKGLEVTDKINDLPPQYITIIRNEINNYQQGGMQEFQEANNTLTFLFISDIPGSELHNHLYEQGINFQNLAAEGDAFKVEVKAKFKDAALAMGMVMQE